jgi:hypothetical protein
MISSSGFLVFEKEVIGPMVRNHVRKEMCGDVGV